MGQTQDTNFHTKTTHWRQLKDAEKRDDLSQRQVTGSWKWWSGPYADMFGTVLGLKIKANTATW